MYQNRSTKKLQKVNYMNKAFLFTFAILLIFISSCSKKSSTIGSNEGKANFELPESNFEYLTTRSKIKFETPNQSLSGTGSIRIKQDSVIWMSITAALGIEAGRVLVTQNEVAIMDRINRTYSVFDYPSLIRRFNFYVDYNILQEIFLGNMPFPLQEKDKINRKGNVWEVKQQLANLLVENFMHAGIMKLENLEIVQKPINNSLKMSFDGYENVSGMPIPFKSAVSLNYDTSGKKQQTTIQIEHSRVDISAEALTFPFSIPDRYTRI